MSETPEVTTPTPSAAPAPAPAAPPAPTAEERQAIARQYLKETHGIEDDNEIPTLRQRARQADELDRALRTQQRPVAPPPPDDDSAWMTREMAAELEQLGRINPMGAVWRYDALKEAHRERREAARQRSQTAQTVAMISASQAYAAQESEAHQHCQREYPEIYDKRTALYRAGQEVYDSMPALRQQGDGFRVAAEIAASRLGILPKSKRGAVSDAALESGDQSVERGSRRPAADAADGPGPTARQLKIAKEMGVDAKAIAKNAHARKSAEGARR